jgi:hypothetical protein
MIGVIAQGETPNESQYREASEALNMQVKAYESYGMPLWGLELLTIPLKAGQTQYSVGLGEGFDVQAAKPLKVIQAWLHSNIGGIDIPMVILTKQEWAILGSKTTKGTPIQIYYNPRREHGEISVFPTPSFVEEHNNYIVITYQRPFEDFSHEDDTPDFPQEWLEALKYGLAERLAPEYGLPTDQRQLLIKESQKVLELALSFGTEEGSVYLQVDRRNY